MPFDDDVINFFAKHAQSTQPSIAAREKAAHDLRETYAILKTKSQTRTLSFEQRTIYGITRLAGTLAVMREVLAKFSATNSLMPTRILDCGSGPGTALLAAYEHFGNTPEFFGVEKDPGFIELAHHAIANLASKAATQFNFVRGVIPDVKLDTQFDLTLFSYVLSETPPDKIDDVLRFALAHTTHALIITDAGTPLVYQHMMAARNFLIEQGWSISAPCPHQHACPMKTPDFCHFPARFKRHEEMRRVKNASAQMEDEKYCYLIATPSPMHAKSNQTRVVKHPLQRSGHIIFDLCTHEGTLERTIVSKKTKDQWLRAKKTKWGDIFSSLPS